MYINDAYQDVTEFLAEGFSALDIKITGWCAGYPGKELKIKGRIDVVDFLKECEGMHIHDQPFKANPNILLAAIECEMQVEGDVMGNSGFCSEETIRRMHNATPWQKQAYQQCIELLDGLTDSVMRGWDNIDELVYEVGQDGNIEVPAHCQLPQGIHTIEITRCGIQKDHIPESDYLDDSGWYLSDFDCNDKQPAKVSELLISLIDLDDNESTISTDGVVMWKTEDELIKIIHYYLQEAGYTLAVQQSEAA